MALSRMETKLIRQRTLLLIKLEDVSERLQLFGSQTSVQDYDKLYSDLGLVWDKFEVLQDNLSEHSSEETFVEHRKEYRKAFNSYNTLRASYHSKRSKLPPSVAEFLSSHARSLTKLAPVVPITSSHRPVIKSPVRNVRSILINKISAVCCSVCQQSHAIVACPTLLQSPVSKRFRLIRSKRLCFNCLSPSHTVSECNSIHQCNLCNSKHHTLLHREITSPMAPFNLSVLGSSASQSVVGQTSLTFGPWVSDEQKVSSDVLVIDRITGDLPTVKGDVSSVDSFRSLRLADPRYHVPAPIDILLGIDSSFTFVDSPDVTRHVACIDSGRYVHDLVAGAESEERASLLVSQLTTVLSRGGFPLRKWVSNCPAILSGLPDKLIGESSGVELGSSCVETLGLNWNPTSDSSTFCPRFDSNLNYFTKRIVLSVVARVFNPLGWLSPCFVSAEILLQTLRQSRVDWDEPLPLDIGSKWVLFSSEMSSLRSVEIPRCVTVPGLVRFELHGFGNASPNAYAAVIYVKVNSSSHGVRITLLASHGVRIALLASKTRMAPLTHQSLPRLVLYFVDGYRVVILLEPDIRSLTFCLIAISMLVALDSVAVHTITLYLAQYMYNWDAVLLGKCLAYAELTITYINALAMSLQDRVHFNSLILELLGSFFLVASAIVKIFALSENLVIIALVVHVFVGLIPMATKIAIFSLVNQELFGSLYSLINVCQNICLCLEGVLSTQVYKYALNSFPTMIFIYFAVFNAITPLVFIWDLFHCNVRLVWDRGRKEYLSQLQSRSKWCASLPPLVVGDVVFVKTDFMPPNSWPLGRIEQLFPGPDGISRVALIRTQTSLLKRPLSKIVLLPH